MNLVGVVFGIISLGLIVKDTEGQSSHMGKITRHYRPVPAIQNTQQSSLTDILNKHIQTLKEDGMFTRNYLETLFRRLDVTLEKIIEYTIKSDLLLKRKYESEDLNDISTKINLMEKKLEMLVNQMKTIDEQEPGEKKIVKALEELQKQVREFEEGNQSAKHPSELETILRVLERIQVFINKSENTFQTLNDSPVMHHESHISTIIKRQMTEEANNVAHKINAMYNDIWKKLSLLDDQFRRSSVSCDTLQKDFNNCLRLSTDIQSDSFDESRNYVEIAVATFKEISNDLIRKFDKELGAVAAALTTATESILHLEGKQKQLEKKMSLILDKIFDTILNKAEGLTKELKDGSVSIDEKHSAIIENIKDLGRDMGSQLNQFVNKIDISSRGVSQIFEKTIQKELNSTQWEMQTYMKALLFSTTFNQCPSDKTLPSLEDESNRDNPDLQWTDSEETVQSIILHAIDAFNGYTTRDQFLSTVNPKKVYLSVEELIMDVKGYKKMPIKFLQQLERWDKATDAGVEDEDYEDI